MSEVVLPPPPPEGLPRKELVSSEQMVGFSTRFLLGGDKVNPNVSIASVANTELKNAEPKNFQSANRAAYDECRQYWESKDPLGSYDVQKLQWATDTATKLMGEKYAPTVAVMKDILVKAANSTNPTTKIDQFSDRTSVGVLFSIHHRYFESDATITHSDGKVEKQPVNTRQFVKDVLDNYRTDGVLNTDRLKNDLPQIRRFTRIFGASMMDSIMGDIIVACADVESQPAALVEKANVQVNGKSRVDSANLAEDEKAKLAYLWKYNSRDARFTAPEPHVAPAPPAPPEGPKDTPPPPDKEEDDDDEEETTQDNLDVMYSLAVKAKMEEWQHGNPGKELTEEELAHLVESVDKVFKIDEQEEEEIKDYKSLELLFADIKQSPNTSSEYFIHGTEFKNPVTKDNVERFARNMDGKAFIGFIMSNERAVASLKKGAFILESFAASCAETPELQAKLRNTLIEAIIDIHSLKPDLFRKNIQALLEQATTEEEIEDYQSQLTAIEDFPALIQDLRDALNDGDTSKYFRRDMDNFGIQINILELLKGIKESSGAAPNPLPPETPPAPPTAPAAPAGEPAKPAPAAKPAEAAAKATTTPSESTATFVPNEITIGLRVFKKTTDGTPQGLTVVDIENSPTGRQVVLETAAGRKTKFPETYLLQSLRSSTSIWQLDETSLPDTVEVIVPAEEETPGVKEADEAAQTQALLGRLQQAAAAEPTTAAAPAKPTEVKPATGKIVIPEGRMSATTTVVPPAPAARATPAITSATTEAATPAKPAAEAKTAAATPEAPPSEFVFDTTKRLLPQLENMVFTRENIALSLGPDLLKKMTNELLQTLKAQRKNIVAISGEQLTIDIVDDKIRIGGEIQGKGKKSILTLDFNIGLDMELENAGGAVRIKPGFKIKGSLGTDEVVEKLRKTLIEIGYDPALELVNFLNNRLKEDNVMLTRPRSTIADGMLKLTAKKEKITTSETPIDN